MIYSDLLKFRVSHVSHLQTARKRKTLKVFGMSPFRPFLKCLSLVSHCFPTYILESAKKRSKLLNSGNMPGTITVAAAYIMRNSYARVQALATDRDRRRATTRARIALVRGLPLAHRRFDQQRA